jgi:hypothetical protein
MAISGQVDPHLGGCTARIQCCCSWTLSKSKSVIIQRQAGEVHYIICLESLYTSLVWEENMNSDTNFLYGCVSYRHLAFARASIFLSNSQQICDVRLCFPSCCSNPHVKHK